MATQVGEVEVAIIARLDKLESDLKRAQKKTEDFSNKGSKSLKKMQGSFSKLSKKGVAAMAALAASMLGLAKVMGDMVKNAGDDEKAVAALRASVEKTGLPVKETTAQLYALADSLDRVSTATATEIIQAESLLLNMGVSTDQMEDAVKASLNLSAALGMDMSSAVRNVGKTMGGFAGELGEILPALKDLSAEALGAGEAIILINEMFGGQYEAAMSTYQGRMKELADSYEAYTAQVGMALIKNEDFNRSIESLTKKLRDPDNVMAGVKFFSGILYGLDMIATGIGKMNDWIGSWAIDWDNEAAGIAFVPDETVQERINELYGEMGEDAIDAFSKGVDKGRRFLISGDTASELAALGMPIPGVEIPTKKKPRASGGATDAEIKARKAFLAKLEDQYLKHKGNLTQISLNQMNQELEVLNTIKFENDQEQLSAELKIRSNHSDRLIEISKAAEEERVDIELAALDRQIEALEEQEKQWQELFDYIGDGFKDALADMIITGEASFKQLGESFLREFVQRAIGSSVDSVFDTIIDVTKGIGGLGWLTTSPSIGGSAENQAITDDQIWDVSGGRPTRSRSSDMSAVSVNVINTTGEKSEVSETQNADGTRNIEVMIGKSVSADIYRGGPIDAAIRNSYGIKRPGSHGA